MSYGMYKPDQGYWTRTCSAIAGLALTGSAIFWGVAQVDRFSLSKSGADIAKWSIGGVLAIIGGLLVYQLIYHKPTPVEFLIATEGEMKKVNWSTRREVMGSTWVVIFVSVSIAAILWVVDLGFSSFFKAIHLLGPGM